MKIKSIEFISGKNSTGFLYYSSEEKKTEFLSLLQLIGCLYFKKHYSTVVSLKSIETLQQLLNLFPSHTADEQHKSWCNEIRSIVSDRITNEEDRMPSITAMWRHWLIRSCWEAKMWTNSTEQNPYHNLPPPEECGWCRNEGGDTL